MLSKGYQFLVFGAYVIEKYEILYHKSDVQFLRASAISFSILKIFK